VLWTLADHAGTLAFYAAEGFHPDGAQRVESGWDARLVRLRQSLAPAPERMAPE
jgi:hypothetical protein